MNLENMVKEAKSQNKYYMKTLLKCPKLIKLWEQKSVAWLRRRNGQIVTDTGYALRLVSGHCCAYNKTH